MARTRTPVRRLGRPPATDSLETRQRILDVARAEFAVHGYEVTTNRQIAARVGITTAALYHYFPSKSDLYVAVLAEAEDAVVTRFRTAVQGVGNLAEQLSLVLDESHTMNSEDPSLAQILGAFRIDERRHPEIGEAVGGRDRPLNRFFLDLVDDAVRRGDLDQSARRPMLALITMILVGLSDAMSDDLRAHRIGVDVAKTLLAGRVAASHSSNN
jgi:AcrR family transcriptional regulator